MIGGPQDGLMMTVPAHHMVLHFPVPIMIDITAEAELDRPTLLSSVYERIGFRGQTVLYRYAGDR